MAAHPALVSAAQTATDAANELSRLSKPSARLKRLTVADHALVMTKLFLALANLSGPQYSLLEKARQLANHHVTGPDSLDKYGPDMVVDIIAAKQRAGAIDLKPAVAKVRADIEELSKKRSPAAEGNPARNHLARQVHRAAIDISLFSTAVPTTGSMEDLAAALHAGCDIIASLKTTFEHEATLIDSAYASIGLSHWAIAVYEILTGGAAALGTAHQFLESADAVAQDEADRLRTSA